MKYFLPLIFFILSSAYAATCTTTSRTNYSLGQKLTSSALNADLNQLITKVNSLDGGCVTDGTLEASSLNATDFAAVTNGIHQGCTLTYIDANTVQVGKCILSVNGTLVKTTTANNVTWGCTSCSAELASTQYYIYAKTGSSGTTLNLLISTTAPGADGYDASGNKVLGKFFNNSSSAIDPLMTNWKINGFIEEKDMFSFSYGTTNATTVCSASPCSYLNQANDKVTSVTLGLAGVYTATFARTYNVIKCNGNISQAAKKGFISPANAASANTVTFTTLDIDGTTAVNSYGTLECEGY